MRLRRGSFAVRLVTLLAGAIVACGGEDICLQCPDGTPTPGQSGAIVTGNIVSSNPSTNPSAMTVIVCVGLDAGGDPSNCPNSFFTTPSTDGTFTRRNVTAGAETIFFWVDADQNGTIDPDDPLARLIDNEGILEDVQSGQTVTIASARINFVGQTATADISIGLTPTPTPTAVQVTPTPSAT